MQNLVGANRQADASPLAATTPPMNALFGYIHRGEHVAPSEYRLNMAGQRVHMPIGAGGTVTANLERCAIYNLEPTGQESLEEFLNGQVAEDQRAEVTRITIDAAFGHSANYCQVASVGLLVTATDVAATIGADSVYLCGDGTTMSVRAALRTLIGGTDAFAYTQIAQGGPSTWIVNGRCWVRARGTWSPTPQIRDSLRILRSDEHVASSGLRTYLLGIVTCHVATIQNSDFAMSGDLDLRFNIASEPVGTDALASLLKEEE